MFLILEDFTEKLKSQHIEKILKELSLWDKKDNRLRQLSGGMKKGANCKSIIS